MTTISNKELLERYCQNLNRMAGDPYVTKNKYFKKFYVVEKIQDFVIQEQERVEAINKDALRIRTVKVEVEVYYEQGTKPFLDFDNGSKKHLILRKTFEFEYKNGTAEQTKDVYINDFYLQAYFEFLRIALFGKTNIGASIDRFNNKIDFYAIPELIMEGFPAEKLN